MGRKKGKVDIQKLLKQYEKQKERTKKYLKSVEKKTLVLAKKEKFQAIAKNIVAVELGKSFEYVKNDTVQNEINEITKLILTIAVAEKKLQKDYNLKLPQIQKLVDEAKIELNRKT